MNDNKMKAKMDVLKELHGHMSKLMGDDVKNGLQKVTVAAPNEKALQKGLESAQDLIKKKPYEQSHINEEDDQKPEPGKSSETSDALQEAATDDSKEPGEDPKDPMGDAQKEAGMSNEDTPEKLDEMIKKLQERKAKMHNDKADAEDKKNEKPNFFKHY